MERPPDVSIVAQSVLPYLDYCVYAWKRGDEYLYIGSGGRGICRLLGGHHVIDKAEDVQDSDVFEFWWFDMGKPDEEGFWPNEPLTKWLEFESAMIRKHRPRYNVTDNPGRKPKLSRKQLKQIDEKYATNERIRQCELEEWTDQSWEV